jgi:Right handed beta helix region
MKEAFVNQRKMWACVFTAVLMLITCASLAQAQATRTWVSGVGDDVNPCSRTAPCKTFAGAISKTAAGGEISALDPGGFGAVTITKSITINGTGTLASITAASTTGIIVNAGVNDVVILRNISINGVGTGLNGIRFLAGAALHIQGCDINGFNVSPALGLDFAPSATSRLFIENTTFRNNGTGVTGGGIRILPTGAGAAAASLRDVTVDRNVTGIRVGNNSSLFMRDSVVAGNSQNGFLAESIAGGLALTFLDHVSLVGNALAGISSSGSNAVVRITNVSVIGNSGTGLQASGGGQIISFGTNNNAGNGVDGAPSGSILQQ